MKMSPLVLFAATALLLTAASVEAVYGPETAASPTDFPQVAVVLYTGTYDKTMPAFIISSRFVITNSYLYEGEERITKAYSGDLSNTANAVLHSLNRVKKPSGGKFSIAKLCPPIENYQPISLIESGNFNYQTNTTGKVLYWRPDQNALFYRTTDVLTDAACAADNAASPSRVTFTAPGHACSQYDPANGSCQQLCYIGGSSKCFPLLLSDANTGAISSSWLCTSDGAGSYKTTGIGLFSKAFYLKDSITPYAPADLA